MFATLLGALPRPGFDDEAGGRDGDGDGDELTVVLNAQAATGLAPLTDGRFDDPAAGDFVAELRSNAAAGVVRRWQRAQAAAGDAPVKQTLPGPWSLAL